MRRVMLLLLAALASAPAGAAEPLVPGAIFDGDKLDKSFNEAVFNGFKRFESETGTAFKERVVGTSEEAHVQGLRDLIKSGANFVVTVGFAFRSSVEKVAREHPEVRFSVIDSVVDLPNVSS
ncbi:MAG TPA: BMP family ABC transporter substrate-binding protein, partial [Azospirillaceae bacterium]|nr:BMP family ABC transporter substrate-binding protein [Azospirillaceae bacterium]